MTSQRVERTWIRTGGYGRFRGEWINHTGNERNFKFNGQVLAKLVSLKDRLADLPPESEALSILDETVELLQERNRKIWIADSSEAGWLTVKFEITFVAGVIKLDLRLFLQRIRSRKGS